MICSGKAYFPSARDVLFIFALCLHGVFAEDICEELEEHKHEFIAYQSTWAVGMTWAIVAWSMSAVGAFIPKSFILRHNHKLIALSIGSMLGTTFFEFVPHMLEQFLGQKCHEHKHELEEHDKAGHDHHDHEGFPLEMRFGVAVLAGILFGFVVESIAHATTGGHSHGHGQCDKECKDKQLREIQMEQYGPGLGNESMKHLHNCDGTPKSKALAGSPDLVIDVDLGFGEKKDQKKKKKDEKSLLESLRTLPVVAIIDIFAKLLHHFVDGAVIGAICLIGVSEGSIIGFNVMLHELSACLGGYAVHVALGVSKRLTTGLSIVKSVTLPIGVAVGITLGSGTGEDTNPFIVYLTPVAMGLFLYMTLADLTPILMHAPLGNDDTDHGHGHGGHAHGGGHHAHGGGHHAHGGHHAKAHGKADKMPTARRLLSAAVLFLFFAVGLVVTAFVLIKFGHYNQEHDD
eukprot:597125_1